MKVKIVSGPPCSGKSTYCKENMKDGDIVYDYDALSNALIYGDTHELERKSTHNYIIDFRIAMLNRVTFDKRKNTLFFITSKTPPQNIIDFIKDIEYEVIEMETTFEECLKNLEKDDKRKEKEKWKERIENWFKEFRMIPTEKLENRQFRKLEDFQADEKEENYIVKGYAAKFAPYVLYEDRDGEVREQFKKESFNDADLSDVIFLYDHKGKVLARNSNGTLKIEIDDVGLYVEADLSTSEASREMYKEIKSGLVNKMSWSFKIGEYHFDKATRTIIHDKIKKVYDVSAVGIPANNDTEINARNFGDGVISKIKAERLSKEQKRKKLLLKIQIEKELK